MTARSVEARPPVPVVVPAAPDTLAEETRALRAAVGMLRDAKGDQALAALDAQDSLYAGGALGEERAATRIDALCLLGRTAEARAAATRFLDAHPRSVLAAHVQASCGAASHL
jgi:hypothetical protein